MPPSEQLEGVDAGCVTVVPSDVESPGTVQLDALDTKRYRAIWARPTLLASLTEVAARRARASLTQAHQVELSDVAVEVGHCHRGVLVDVDRFGLMTFVHGGRYRCVAAAVTTAATIGSHSTPG